MLCTAVQIESIHESMFQPNLFSKCNLRTQKSHEYHKSIQKYTIIANADYYIQHYNYYQTTTETVHPIFLLATGDLGPLATTFYQRLADQLANKHDIHYSKALLSPLLHTLLLCNLQPLCHPACSWSPGPSYHYDHTDMVLVEARLNDH